RQIRNVLQPKCPPMFGVVNVRLRIRNAIPGEDIFDTARADVETIFVHYSFDGRFVRGLDKHRARRWRMHRQTERRAAARPALVLSDRSRIQTSMLVSRTARRQHPENCDADVDRIQAGRTRDAGGDSGGRGEPEPARARDLVPQVHRVAAEPSCATRAMSGGACEPTIVLARTVLEIRCSATGGAPT